MKKSFLALLLAAIMVLSLVPMTVFAASFSKSEISNPTLYESGCLKTLDVTIQAINEGYTPAYGKIGVHTEASSYSYTNQYISSKNCTTWPETINDPTLVGLSTAEFLWTDCQEHTVTVQFEDGEIPCNQDKTYVVHLWTRAEIIGIYPDHTFGNLVTNANGKLFFGDKEIVINKETITNGTPESAKETNHGYITIDKATAAEGETVTVTVNPADGYQLKSLTYKPAPKTVADILPEDFPSAESETSGAPAGAWKSATLDQLCYLSSDGSKLLFYSESGDPDKSFGIDTDAVLSADEGDYVYENGGVTVTFTMSGEGGTMNSVIFADTESETWSGTYQESACVAAGTMVTMSDGGRKKIEDLKIGDVIRTFDHENGEVSSAPVCFIWESKNAANAFELTFEGGIKVTVVEAHGFFDCDENKYVFINAGNAKDYIGHHFYNADLGSRPALESIVVLQDRVDAYAIAAAGHLNHLSEGMLSVCDGTFEVFANLFEYDSSMKYDEALKKKDIETYGLTSPEKVLEYKGFNEADYYDYNLKYTGIALGKGLITPEWIKELSDYCEYNNIYDSLPAEIPAAPVSVSLANVLFESGAEDGTEITADGDGNYIFTMPGYAVVVTAEFESAYCEISLSLEDGLDKDNIPEGTDFIVTIQLTGASPENEDVRVSVSSGESYDLITDSNGQAFCEIKGLPAGSYIMIVEHGSGDNAVMALMTFAVTKQTSPETGDAVCAAVLVMLTALSAGVVLGKKKKNAR